MAYKIGLYPEWWDSIESLSLEDKGKILDNIFSYSVKGEIEHKGYIEIIFNFMKNRIDADKESYENKCHKNQEIGKLGGRPKKTYKNRSVISETQTVISKPNSNSNSNYNILSKDNNNIYFDLFWKEYPLKKGKPKAMIAFDNATKKTDAHIIIDGAKLYYNECKREGTAPKYIKRPQGWLNEKRWEDIQEDIEPDVENKGHYEWYKRNIIGNEFTDLDGTKLKYKDINYRRFLIYERSIERTKAQELYEKAKGERVDLSI